MQPKFKNLSDAYTNLLKTQGNTPCSQNWGNQCAIRMSISLIEAGVSFTNYTEPKCKHGHGRGAESLANWLWKYHLNRPHIFPSTGIAKDRLTDRQGIIFYKNCFTREGQTRALGDHIDVWYQGFTMTWDDPDENAQQVWFWDLT